MAGMAWRMLARLIAAKSGPKNFLRPGGMGPRRVLLTGEPLGWRELNAAADGVCDGSCRVDLSAEAWRRVRAARAVVLSSNARTYGISTGLGIHADDANAGEQAEFGIRILRAHATQTRPEKAPLPVVRATLLLWCNQAAAAVGGLPGVSAELLSAILRWVHDCAATPPRLDALEIADPGFGAIVVCSQLAVHVLGELDDFPVRPGEALPLMSHNNILASYMCAVVAMSRHMCRQ